ncbi:MAG: hypothetical protein IKI22_04595 [Neisseriaceae bacterium]|nr:hypothetical protein [Neisseriaceae bacterium]
MLSSRYIHLHEALGLGPIWLKRSAFFVKDEPKQHTFILQPTIKPTVTAEETKPVYNEQIYNANIALRSTYTVTKNKDTNTLWLTLRHNLNTAPHEINTCDFGKLIQHLIYASDKTIQPIWHALDSNLSYQDNVLQIISQQQISQVVVLGEDLHSIEIPVKKLQLPHPAHILRNPKQKADIWQKIKQFFY